MEKMAHWQEVSLSLPRCSYLFVLHETSHVGTNMTHIELSSRKGTPNDIPRQGKARQGASDPEKRCNE